MVNIRYFKTKITFISKDLMVFLLLGKIFILYLDLYKNKMDATGAEITKL
jgi:hypothetical protein